MAENNFDLQAEELESLTYIYPEELIIKKERPFSFEVMINSNTETEERNFLKMKMMFELQLSYPDVVPFFRLKNLSPDYMDNKFIDYCETILREKGEECIGSMMIFEMCDLIREKISSINETVLQRVDAVTEVESMSHGLQATVATKKLDFTPVTKETFARWCEDYMARLQAEKESRRTGNEDKPTGRQLFEENKEAFEDMTLDDEPTESVAVAEESKEAVEEEDEGEDF